MVMGEAVSSTSIMVSWEPPARTCGVIRRYKILYKVLYGGKDLSSVVRALYIPSNQALIFWGVQESFAADLVHPVGPRT